MFGLSYCVRIVRLHTSDTLTFNSSPHSSPFFTPHSFIFSQSSCCHHLPSHPKSTHHTVTTPCVYLLVKTTTQPLTVWPAVLACTRTTPVINQWNTSFCPVDVFGFFINATINSPKTLFTFLHQRVTSVELCCLWPLCISFWGMYIISLKSTQAKKDCWCQQAC